MGPSTFAEQLRDLGFEATEHPDGRVTFPYTVPVGKYSGTKLELGFQVAGDFPINPPSGPHLKPRLLPTNPAADAGHPLGGVHESPTFGDDWQYWSRPYPEWQDGDRSVRAYLAHVRHLFEKQ
jgi:hypothetical protein